MKVENIRKNKLSSEQFCFIQKRNDEEAKKKKTKNMKTRKRKMTTTTRWK